MTGTPKEWLEVAKAAIREGAFQIEDSRKKGSRVESAFGRDIKLAADKAADLAMTDFLKKNSPFTILSEESGLSTVVGSELRWIVDPLDGSFNFHRGLPCYGISVALWEENEPLVGAVLDISHAELFSGIVGEGAWCNEKPISVSELADRSQAALCTGFPVASDFDDESLQSHFARIRSFKKVRMLGSAAVALCQVACGRADFYLEQGVQFWDVAGGLALVKAAGGNVSLEQRTKGGWNIEAWNGRLGVEKF